jgi:hypothetical protein
MSIAITLTYNGGKVLATIREHPIWTKIADFGNRRLYADQLGLAAHNANQARQDALRAKYQVKTGWMHGLEECAIYTGHAEETDIITEIELGDGWRFIAATNVPGVLYIWQSGSFGEEEAFVNTRLVPYNPYLACPLTWFREPDEYDMIYAPRI